MYEMGFGGVELKQVVGHHLEGVRAFQRSRAKSAMILTAWSKSKALCGCSKTRTLRSQRCQLNIMAALVALSWVAAGDESDTKRMLVSQGMPMMEWK